MTRSELVSAVWRENWALSNDEVDRVVSFVLEAVSEQLARGGRVELRGFGSFSTRARLARIGRNPRTGVGVEILPKRVPYFKPSKQLRSRLNVRDE